MRGLIIRVVGGMLLAGAVAAAGAEAEPRVVQVGAVAPDILAVEVQAREVAHGKLQPYVKRDGDEFREEPQQTWLVRGGTVAGVLAGPERRLYWTFDTIAGRDLDTKRAMTAAAYTVRPAGGPPFTPAAVYRKSKPRDMARLGPWAFACSLSHKLYLRLPAALEAGRAYAVDMQALGLGTVRYVHDPAAVRSEAVHVNQVGFRPRDGVKRAYLSCWLGDGGGVDYAAGTRFAVVDVRTGAAVFTGTIRLGVPATKSEDAYGNNHNGTNVYWLDFAGVQTPGRYQIVVDGIGSSASFEIGDDVYAKAFYVSARGWYHQRSGIELRPPYTTFTRPRPFHPADGFRVYASTCSLMESGNGLNLHGSDSGNFGNLVKGATDEVVPDAWGGYFDAGDWDRRIQHLDGARFLLELADLFPGEFKDNELNLPESGNGIPDILDEAMWGLDVFRRMQTADGGIRGGIEQTEHPSCGETSWLESKKAYAYAPDEWSSYIYAGDAARAAGVLRRYSAALADAYAASALRAFAFAERRTRQGADLARFEVRDSRNRAALELWRLTGDAGYHAIFLDTTIFRDPRADPWVWQKQDQRDAAFLYARLDLPGQDARVKANARAVVLREARMQPVESTGFNWSNLNVWNPIIGGSFSTPRMQIARAHYLSRDPASLNDLVLSCQSGLGANPVNISYTVGLGQDWPRHPLICDARVGNLPPFPGVTVYGPTDPKRMKHDFGQKLVAPAVYPAVETWPSSEGFFDVFLFPMQDEFTVMQTIAPMSYTLGYLRAVRFKPE